MDATDPSKDATTPAGFDPAPWFRWTAAATTALVLVQAVLAGRGWFVDLGLIEVHGWVGNATFLVVAAQTGLAFLARQRRRLGRLDVALSGLLLLLIVAQLGLGYAGRESAAAASWHVPTGVLIFGASAALLTRAFDPDGSPRGRSDATA